MKRIRYVAIALAGSGLALFITDLASAVRF